ncbi:MAG: DUF2490 domain-containing protein [Paludibacteraceae bacterium]|nr:DUF2490 domain-containing protein [Paludibacteraceae bacterium]
MRVFIKIVLAFFAFVFAIGAVQAQTFKYDNAKSYNVGQIRTGAEFHYRPVKGLSLVVTPEVYLDFYNSSNDQVKVINRINGSFEIGYKVNRYFKFSAFYTCLGVYHNAKEGRGVARFWEAKHRVGLNVKGTLPIGRFKLSLREQFRTTFRPMIYNETYFDYEEKQFAAMELRSRIKLEYDVFSKPVKPFVSVEMANRLNQQQYVSKNLLPGDYWLKSMRYRLGVEWRLDKYSSFTFYYEFAHSYNFDVDIKSEGAIIEIDPEVTYSHHIGAYYTLRF